MAAIIFDDKLLVASIKYSLLDANASLLSTPPLGGKEKS